MLVELPIPLAAHNVIVEDRGPASPVPQPFIQISVIDFQPVRGKKRNQQIAQVLVPQHGRLVERRHKIHSVAPLVISLHRDLRQITGSERDIAVVLVVVLVLEKRGKIRRPQALAKLHIRIDTSNFVP